MTTLEEYAETFQAMQAATETGDSDEVEALLFNLLDELRENRPDLMGIHDVKAEVQVGSLVEGGFNMVTDFPFHFNGLNYNIVMNAFQACKAANHDENGIFIGDGYKSKDTLDIRIDYCHLTLSEANHKGKNVFIKDIRQWDTNKDTIMTDIIVAALKLDDPTSCKVDFTKMPTEDARIVHFGPNEYYGVNPQVRTHDGYSKGNNLVGRIVTDYYHKWKNKKMSSSSPGSSQEGQMLKKSKGKKLSNEASSKTQRWYIAVPCYQCSLPTWKNYMYDGTREGAVTTAVKLFTNKGLLSDKQVMEDVMENVEEAKWKAYTTAEQQIYIEQTKRKLVEWNRGTESNSGVIEWDKVNDVHKICPKDVLLSGDSKLKVIVSPPDGKWQW